MSDKNLNFLTALPVYNEAAHVDGVLRSVLRASRHVLVVDDGSTDGTGARLSEHEGVRVITHPKNRGYGAALKTAFQYASENNFDYLVTIDCDGQHEPQRIPWFVEACHDRDMVSGSRYLQEFDADRPPPLDRQSINRYITEQLNRQLDLNLTDAFCGFKTYRVAALRDLNLIEDGYSMPIELWVQAVRLHWRIKELPVPLIYLEEERSFGGALDDASTRLEYYRLTLQRSLADVGSKSPSADRPCGEKSA